MAKRKRNSFGVHQRNFVSFLYRIGAAPLAMLLTIRGYHQIASGQALILNQNKPGSAQGQSISASTAVTIGAGNKVVTKNIIDMSSLLTSLDPSEDNEEAVVDSVILHLHFDSAYNFWVTPFLIKLENGETVADTEAASYQNELTHIGNCVSAGQYQLKIGEALSTHVIHDNGSVVYETEGVYDFTKECQRYMREYYQNMQDEEPIKPFRFGFVIQMDTLNKSFNYWYRRVIDSHTKENKISQRF